MPKRLSDKINIGVCDITFTPDGQLIPIYLGITKGGATLEYEPKYHDLEADQTGETILDSILIGEEVKFTTNLLDTTKEHMSIVMPTADKEGGSSLKAVTFGRRPGLRLGHHTGLLRIHPISAGVGNVGLDAIIYRAANKAKLELAYKLDEEWVIPCEFIGYPDEFRPEGDQLFRIGDMTEYKAPTKRIVSFWITPANQSTTVNGTIQFSANVMYDDGTTEDKTSDAIWTTSDTEVTILPGGLATGNRAGTVVVQAKLAGYSSSTTVTVS